MKNALKLVLFPFFAMGVYGVDSVSVTEGESVTLNSDVTKINSSDTMEWRLNQTRIFRISSDNTNHITVFDDTDGVYGDRLKLNNQTGDLKITNIKTTDSGEYKLKITTTKESSEKIFNVSVALKSSPSPEPGPSPESVSPVAGLSSGAIAGIVIGVIAAVAAAAGGIFYGYGKKGQML